MDTIHELRKVLEIQLNYMDIKKKNTEEGSSPLTAVRRDITHYKKHLSILTPVSVMLGSLVCIAAFGAVLGATWIPWDYMGFLVVASFAIILSTIHVYQKLEQVKKRELFLFMLHKMDKKSHN